MWLTRVARAVAVVVATAGAALWVPAWARDFTVIPSRTSGLPGELVTVTLGGEDAYGRPIGSCDVSFDINEDKKVACQQADDKFQATIAVPATTARQIRLEWRIRPREEPEVDLVESSPTPITDGVPFTVLRVDVDVTPAEVKRGEPVTVTFTGRPVLDDLACRITWPEKIPCPAASTGPGSPAPSVRFTIPKTAREGLPFSFRWHFDYRFRGEAGHQDGTSTVWILLPPPVFRAQADGPTVNPGLPLVVTFTSETADVTITGCGLTHRGVSVRCNGSYIAAIVVPPDTKPGTAMTVDYEIAYTSKRPREPDNVIHDTISVRVVAEQPRFIVSATPGRGPPGKEVTLTLEPAVPGVAISDCIAFFPGDRGGTCQRSAERWLVRTRVPDDALPGATLLRWAIASMRSTGRPGADGGVLPFEVLAGPSPSRSSSPSPPPLVPPPATSSTATSSPAASSPATSSTATSSPAASSPAASSPAAGRPPPVFVAVIDPESAAPGERVTVTVQALTPGTVLTGCDATLGGARARCGLGWTATLTVPAGARPGDLPLIWHATSSDGPGSGRLSYRVRPGDRPAEPQFAAAVDPRSVRPGGHVTLTPQAYAGSAAITGCTAAFSPHGVPTTCHQAGVGWGAEVTVPPDAPPGTGSIMWRIAYTTPANASARSTDGVVTVGVDAQPPPPPDKKPWWRDLAGIGWRVALGGVALAGLIGSRLVTRRLRSWWNGRADQDDDTRPAPATSVTALKPAGPPRVTVADPDAGPRREIRLTVHRGRPVASLHEEPP